MHCTIPPRPNSHPGEQDLEEFDDIDADDSCGGYSGDWWWGGDCGVVKGCGGWCGARKVGGGLGNTATTSPLRKLYTAHVISHSSEGWWRSGKHGHNVPLAEIVHSTCHITQSPINDLGHPDVERGSQHRTEPVPASIFLFEHVYTPSNDLGHPDVEMGSNLEGGKSQRDIAKSSHLMLDNHRERILLPSLWADTSQEKFPTPKTARSPKTPTQFIDIFILQQRYLVTCYNATSDVNDARLNISTTNSRNVEGILPTADVLKLHVLRSCYQGGHKCEQLKAIVELPGISLWGWEDVNNSYSSLWKTQLKVYLYESLFAANDEEGYIYRKCIRIGVEGGCKTILGKKNLSTPYHDSSLDLPAIDNLVYCESSTLYNVATEAASRPRHRLRIRRSVVRKKSMSQYLIALATESLSVSPHFVEVAEL
uniref:Uncharacterized protein n=1 Tax=Timema tahoe TaxID=61484 RepID=A0A7R9FIZ6_9NEOP|nr:unnamed protein product [Timema tahoe]